MQEIIKYTDKLLNEILIRISTEVNEFKVDEVINILNSYLTKKPQTHYFKILSNREYFLATANFFVEFKQKYSLQGIDRNYLNKLEKDKVEILSLIESENLLVLYTKYFERTEIKSKDKFIQKDLVSFFSKFVHSYLPNKYCALDNPVKDYLGLSKEGFYISFFLISESYKIWTKKNRVLVDLIRQRFFELDKDSLFQHNRITDQKLLDLIFWQKADNLKKEKKRQKE